MSFKLTILGSNSAIPKENRNPTSQVLSFDEKCFLIDCGEGTQNQLRKYQIRFQKISHIFISHLHGDHYFGLIGLLTTMHLLGRERDLHIYAHENLKKIIDSQLEASNTLLSYPLFFHSITENYEGILFEDNKICISTFLLDHGILCNGFLFQEKILHRKILSQKIQQHNVPHDEIIKLQSGDDFFCKETSKKIANDELTVPNRNPFSYAFCSDTKYNELIVDKIKGVTVLYHEATFMIKHKDRACVTNHATSEDAALIAKKANVKYLLIGHFSQRYSNYENLLLESKSIFSNTMIANQGLELDFHQL